MAKKKSKPMDIRTDRLVVCMLLEYPGEREFGWAGMDIAPTGVDLITAQHDASAVCGRIKQLAGDKATWEKALRDGLADKGYGIFTCPSGYVWVSTE